MSTRERLLEAAIGCLQTRGYARTTIREIVAAANSHLPAVNYFFGSKERLLHEATVQALLRWSQATLASTEAPAPLDPRSRLRVSVERFLAAIRGDRSGLVAAVEAFAQAERDEVLRARLAGAYDDLRTEIALGGDDDSRAVASVLIALLDGLALQCLLDPQRAPTGPEVVRSLDTVARVLAAAAPPGNAGAGSSRTA
jgi:AcrR family transcriptional regulator